MKKVAGIFSVLVLVFILTSIREPGFIQAGNIQNIARWTGMYGILTIGVSFVIITGGIDLSVGAIVGLTGTLLPMFLTNPNIQMPVWLAVITVLAIAVLIGLIHGLLVTKLKLQPFVVTLCGLFAYRGFARYIVHDATQGFGTAFTGLRLIAKQTIPLPFVDVAFRIPLPFIIMIAIAILAAIFLNRSIYGRYLLALGNNEQAARYSGINTNRMTIAAYIISSTLAGFVGMLFALDLNSIQPSTLGNFFELYAIAGAVLGGCSLRGGQGSILGVIIGTAIVRVLYNAINILGIATQLEYTVIGIVLLAGIVMDEILRRYSAKRLAARETQSRSIKNKD
ncbi:MAG: ABC transporter permease [Planctomycetota bacterium]|jgi:ribose transport system permease protein